MRQIKVIISRAELVHDAQLRKTVSIHIHSFRVELAGGWNCVFSFAGHISKVVQPLLFQSILTFGNNIKNYIHVASIIPVKLDIIKQEGEYTLLQLDSADIKYAPADKNLVFTKSGRFLSLIDTGS